VLSGLLAIRRSSACGGAQTGDDLARWAVRRLPKASYRLGRTAAGRTTIWLLRDVVVDGLPCARGSRLEFDRGRVVAATLARETTIGGLVLAAGHPFRLVDGRLVAGVLARPTVIDGVVCAADKITLSLQGELECTRAPPNGP
jgi:hypothetical protein